MIRLLPLLLLIGCTSNQPIPAGSEQPEPQTIIEGAEGQLDWGFTLDLGIIDPIVIKIFGNRSKGSQEDVLVRMKRGEIVDE